MTEQCGDLETDRKIGASWETKFCVIAFRYRKSLLTAHQIGRTGAACAVNYENQSWGKILLPDVTLWTNPIEHHEIKHKNATKNGRYGLEAYRLQSLFTFASVTRSAVFYTIHDWELA